MRLVARLPTHPIVSALLITAVVIAGYALIESSALRV
jgi:multisubunit Na+/H+ antiporter MnhC subunit